MDAAATQGRKFGYARVSSADQNLERQLLTLADAGIADDDVFIEKASAAKDAPRDVLDELLNTKALRRGDELVVSSWDRIARSVADMDNIVDSLNTRGVTVTSIAQRQTFAPGDGDAMERAMRQMMGVFAELERSVIRERQAEGIAAAKKRGVYSGGMTKLTADEITSARERIALGVPKARIARMLNVSRQTLDRALKPGYVPRAKPRKASAGS